MITNREISTTELLGMAVTEVVESARENGVDEAEIAATLREQAATVAEAGAGEPVDAAAATADAASGTDDADPADEGA